MRQRKNSAQQRTRDASQLANASHLGEFIGEYPNPKTRKLEAMRMLRGFAVLLLGVVLVTLAILLLGPLVGIAGAVLGALGLGYSVEGLFYLTSRHIYTFTDGFIYFKRSKPVVFRWEDVRFMLKRGMQSSFVAQYVEIQHTDGHWVTFRIRHTDPFILVLDTQVGMRVAGARKANMIKAYEAGRVLTCGPLELSLAGVSYQKRLLPWSDIDQIFLLSGTLHIRTVQEKQSDWATLPEAEHIPDIAVFIELTLDILVAHRPSL